MPAFPVTIVETSQDALTRGLDVIAKNYADLGQARQLERRRDGATHRADQRHAPILAAVADADIVIEAVFEEMDVKKQVFGELDRLAQADAMLATNTSYLDVDEIARSHAAAASVLGMHFFSPANVMRLLEIVRGDEHRARRRSRPRSRSAASSARCRSWSASATASSATACWRARSIEAERLLLEGALPQEVDGALTEFGFPMGPFAMSDLAGLDVGWRMRKAQGVQRARSPTRCARLGRFGQKTGKGFYRYEAGRARRSPIRRSSS